MSYLVIKEIWRQLIMQISYLQKMFVFFKVQKFNDISMIEFSQRSHFPFVFSNCKPSLDPL